MERITIDSRSSRSEILVGESLSRVAEMVPDSNAVIITDENVYDLYGNSFPGIPVLVIKPGEESKRLDVIGRLAGDLLAAGLDRSGFILGIGGGVVCDIAGFLASVYMRGIRFGFVSTTLLSQVDASTGGKNGVNLGIVKNIIGVIRQPEFVICDTALLQTLPQDEYLSGLAELIKTAIIGDRELFGIIEANKPRILQREDDLLTLLVSRAVRFKAYVVSEDEMENGLRKVLNFGHTFGHAIELSQGVKHGFAVAAGMELAAVYSQEKGYLSPGEAGRIVDLLSQFGLLTAHSMDDTALRDLILHDKKKSGKQIYFLFSEGIGQVIPEKTPVDELVDFYGRFRDKKTGI